jgi:hypothetical protein
MEAAQRHKNEGEFGGDPKLRSAKEILTYKVKALDSEMGRLDDLIELVYPFFASERRQLGQESETPDRDAMGRPCLLGEPGSRSSAFSRHALKSNSEPVVQMGSLGGP